MKEYFRVRPKIVEHESLTSYIFRLAKLNETTFSAIVGKIKTKAQFVQNRRFKYLDVNPVRMINIDLLSDLACVSKEELLSHTLHPFVLGISSESEMKLLDQFSTTGMKRFYDGTKRWFCSMCLKDHNIFNILWQFKSVTFCEIHKCYLQKSCSTCGHEQPYIGNHLVDGSCHTCGLSLSSDEEEILSENILNDETTLNQFWRPFLSLTGPMTPVQFDLSIKQTISLKILYILNDLFKEEFSARESMFRRDKTHFKKMILTGNFGESSFLDTVIRFFMFSGISIDQLRDLKVHKKFYYSFVESKDIEGEKHFKIARNCETPWCKYRNKVDGMQYLRISPGNFYCSGCYIKYGYQKKTGKWIDLKGDINLIEKLIPRMHQNHARYRMFKEITGISPFRLNEIIGYMCVHKLVPKNYKSEYDKVVVPPIRELSDKFKILIEQVGRQARKLQSKAIEVYGWKVTEFACYYHQKEVQEVILNTRNKINDASSSYKTIYGFLNDYINSYESRNLCMPYKNNMKPRFSNCILFLYGVEQIILAINKSLLLEEEKVYVDHCWNVANQYVNQQKKEKSLLKAGDIYRALDRKYGWIKNRNPDLVLWINKQVIESREEIKRLGLEEKKEELEQAMEYLKENDLNISKSAIERVTGLKYYEISGENELSDHYYKLLNRK
ncbi:TniQ family protein [Paenibacillus taichungensis]|uniref:TniQ family protein n=1 Tax=Paenibacillus taichungensis TaxID=484184 RepID=UPI002DB93D8C|nr:TniQ family protein [Paenibacillus taichungensis]MEC0105361.1 TniQ family protein [Paenibacillus taichungensis]MEC0200436.1 TniQ family protein [Paenibacillus taichungensis]